MTINVNYSQQRLQVKSPCDRTRMGRRDEVGSRYIVHTGLGLMDYVISVLCGYCCGLNGDYFHISLTLPINLI